jgi:hypothetical protein
VDNMFPYLSLPYLRALLCGGCGVIGLLALVKKPSPVRVRGLDCGYAALAAIAGLVLC